MSVVSFVCQMTGQAGWSWRFCPTPARSTATSMPSSRRWVAGPMPESISSCGLLIAPPDRTTSAAAYAVCSRPCAT